MTKVPVLCAAQGGYVIYLRPTWGDAKRNLANTHGKQFDPIERGMLVGGVPEPFERLPMVFASKAEAEASLKIAGQHP